MGKTLEETKTEISVADIVNYGEKLILPEGMSVENAVELLLRRQKYLETEVVINEKFDVFPWDGAYAFSKVLTKKYGWVPQTPTPGFFGDNPPKMISIEIGYGEHALIPWGRFGLPNIDGFLQTDVSYKDGRIVFAMTAKIKRKNEAAIRSLMDDTRAYLAENSIYRGKAVKIRFRDKDGDKLEMPEPKFLNTNDIKPEMLIYSKEVKDQLYTNLFTPIERVNDLIANNIDVKRGILLGGPFGTGKTLAAKLASALANLNGITYLYVPRADELSDALEFAKQYQSPACIVFCEDIDRAMNGERDVKMDDILNIIDGLDTKNSNIITVLTTNDLHGINAAMLRPGRLDAVIEVTPPDGPAVEQLLRLYGGNAISHNTNLEKAGEIMAGNIPAVIAEVVKRAKLAQLRLQAPGTRVQQLTEEAIVESAKSMRYQLELLRIASTPVETPDTLSEAVEKAVANAMRERTQLPAIAERVGA